MKKQHIDIEISKDLTRTTHVENITSKSNSTPRLLGLLKRNISHCPTSSKKNAYEYVPMVRSKLEYGSSSIVLSGIPN